MLQILVLLLAAAPVLLISLDGFRHDYIERDKPPELSALAEGGARVMRIASVVFVDDVSEPPLDGDGT